MKNRSPVLLAFLNLITIGFYMLYWLYVTRKEMTGKGLKIPPFWLLLIPFAIIFLSIPLQWIADTLTMPGEAWHSHDNGRGGFFGMQPMGIAMAIAATTVYFPLYFFWIFMYSRAVEKVTKGQLPTLLNMGLLVGLHMTALGFAWPAFVQYSFNKTRR